MFKKEFQLIKMEKIKRILEGIRKEPFLYC